MKTKLSAHPRLYIGPTELRRLRRAPSLDWLAQTQAQLQEDAAGYANNLELKLRSSRFNAHLLRAREAQLRVLTLLAVWEQTRLPSYRRAVIAHIQMMHDWDYWSWLTWRSGDNRADAIFDLSYGENSATLAIAYDWLHDSLTTDEQKLLLATAEKWSFPAGERHAKARGAWWYGFADSNWNAVCAGGLGMLCLAMHDDSPRARRLLPRVERSITPFMTHLNETKGAWPEGIGYWNYGMRYAFMYLLSWRNAFRREHPLLGEAGVRKTIAFPLDFCPNGQACSFGDVNSWRPLPFHYHVARLLRQTPVVRAIDSIKETSAVSQGNWPDHAEWLLFHPDKRGREVMSQPKPVCKLYKGLDWGILADQAPNPQLYMTIRGGTTQVPHGQRDLLSFHCVVGNERLLSNATAAEYLDTTFSSRREEIFELGPLSKNTILINGVGITAGSSLDVTEIIKPKGAQGLRLVATTAMGDTRDGPAANFCGRAILHLPGHGFLIIDQVILPHAGRVESRMHSSSTVRLFRSGALLRGVRETLRVSYGANIPYLCLRALTAPTTPSVTPETQLRLCSESLHTDMTLLTWLTPGRTRSSVALESNTGGEIGVVCCHGEWSSTIRLRPDLRPIKPARS